MMDTVKTTYSPWKQYMEHDGKIKNYICRTCKNKTSGRMQRRIVTEPTGGSHKEYKIVCEVCGHKSSVHWSKVLTENCWNADGGD